MSENLGDAVLHLTVDGKDYDLTINTAQKKTESLSGAMIKAQAAYELFKQAVKFVGEQLKECVTQYVESEKAAAQLNAVLKSTSYAAGMTSTSVNDIASNLSKLTGIEDDSIVKAENLLLTFTKVGKDVFPLATETILDMSTALRQSSETTTIQVGKMLQNADAMAAAKRVGVSFTDEQIKLGKELEASGRMAEYQAMILKELQTEFGGSARAARDTFGGALTALENNFGNMQESVGQYLVIAGRPFVEEMIKMTDGINEFLQSQEGMNTAMIALSNVAGVLAVAGDTGKNLFDIFSKFVGGIFKDLTDGFNKLVGKSLEGVTAFDVLGGTLQGVGAGFTIIGKIVRLFIQGVADLIFALGKAQDTLGKFGAAMLDPFNSKKWDEVGAAVKLTIDSFATFGVNAFNNVKDIIVTTKNEFDNFGTKAKNNSEELKKTFTNSSNSMITTFKEFQEKLKKEQETQAAAVKDTQEKITTANKTLSEELNKIATDMEAKWSNASTNIVNAINTIGNAVAPVFDAIGSALFKQGDAWKNVGKAGVYAIANIVKALGDQLAAMAAVDFIKGVAAVASVVGAPAAPGFFASSAILGGGAAAAYVASGALKAWGDSFEEGGTMEPNTWNLVGEGGPEIVGTGKYASRVYNAQDTAQMLSNGIIINNTFGDINNDIDLELAMQRMGLSVRSALRSKAQ